MAGNLTAPLRIDENSTAAERVRAAQALTSGNGSVVFEELAVLRATSAGIRCDVYDRTPGARRCAFEADVLVENAQRAFAASGFSALLCGVPLEWRVVELDPSDAD